MMAPTFPRNQNAPGRRPVSGRDHRDQTEHDQSQRQHHQEQGTQPVLQAERHPDAQQARADHQHQRQAVVPPERHERARRAGKRVYSDAGRPGCPGEDSGRGEALFEKGVRGPRFPAGNAQQNMKVRDEKDTQ